MATSGRVTTDEVLQFVLKNFITLHDEDKKTYVRHYSAVIDKLINVMKEKDCLFEAIYCRVYYAGSYYDGLKVGKPEEFDLDVVMKLPINEREVEFIRRGVKPPFTMVKAVGMEQLKHHPKWPIYRFMDSWTDRDGYLLQDQFRAWWESVVRKALNTLPALSSDDRVHVLQVNGDTYKITERKTGPAMTFTVTIPGGSNVDVDFVPVIEFQNWPSAPIRENLIPNRKSWFIVPKPNSKNVAEFNKKYWRLAFHDQEREMINGKDRLKPVCRLLKKLRDNNTALIPVASYYIKTLFLWDIVEKRNDVSYFSKSSLTVYFINMLKMLRDQLKEGHIKYFWDDRYDLLSGMDKKAKENCEGRLNNIIKEIETKLNDNPKIIAKYILTPEEYRKVEAYNGENSRSPPLVQAEKVTNQMANVRMSEQVPAAESEATLETVFKLLISMQQEMVEQKKVAQRVLGKINVLQNTVDQLVDENASLRDELRLTRLHSKNDIITNPPLLIPSLIDLPSEEFGTSDTVPLVGRQGDWWGHSSDGCKMSIIQNSSPSIDRLLPTEEVNISTIQNSSPLVDRLLPVDECSVSTMLNCSQMVDTIVADQQS